MGGVVHGAENAFSEPFLYTKNNRFCQDTRQARDKHRKKLRTKMRFLQGQLANVSGELRVKNPHCIPQPAYPNVSLSVVCEPPPPTPAPTRSVKTDDDVDAAAPSRCAETPPAYTDLDVQIEGEPQVIFTEEEAIHAAHGLGLALPSSNAMQVTVGVNFNNPLLKSYVPSCGPAAGFACEQVRGKTAALCRNRPCVCPEPLLVDVPSLNVPYHVTLKASHLVSAVEDQAQHGQRGALDHDADQRQHKSFSL
jgi:hypothetical protein